MAVDHTRSFVPNYSMSRKSIRNGDIGGLTRIVAHMGGTRAMLFRNGTHIVDLINFFADADPVWVLAVHEQGFEDYGTEYKGEGGKDPALDQLIKLSNEVVIKPFSLKSLASSLNSSGIFFDCSKFIKIYSQSKAPFFHS